MNCNPSLHDPLICPFFTTDGCPFCNFYISWNECSIPNSQWTLTSTIPHQAAPTPRSQESYAQLLFDAFIHHKARENQKGSEYIMSLQEIYLWFTENQKEVVARQGWQKSIRHNLSMNPVSYQAGKGRIVDHANAPQAFSPPDSVGKKRKRGLWRLDPAAVVNGGVPPTSQGRNSR